jgi:hypothetical protein
MKNYFKMTVLVSAILCLLLPNSVAAARRKSIPPVAKTYQVTGPVLEVTNDMIVVQKGKERWEVGRDSGTKVNGDLKVGSNVTIQYRMTAVVVDVKAAKAAAANKAAPANKAKPANKKP